MTSLGFHSESCRAENTLPTHVPPTPAVVEASNESLARNVVNRILFGRSWRSFLSSFSALSVVSLASIASLLSATSLLSTTSFLSVLSVNSALSVLSVNSFMAIGCIGESFSICY